MEQPQLLLKCKSDHAFISMKPFSGSYPRPISLTFFHSFCSISYHLSPFIAPYYPGLCFDYQTRQALVCLWGPLPEMFSCSSRVFLFFRSYIKCHLFRELSLTVLSEEAVPTQTSHYLEPMSSELPPQL